MGQCTKPGGFKACSQDTCIGCGHHVIFTDFDKFWDNMNSIEFEKTSKQLLKLKELYLEQGCHAYCEDTKDTHADAIVPLLDCTHTSILVSEYGYICEGCKKQMKLVDGKFVPM
jgi:hypothetical protein